MTEKEFLEALEKGQKFFTKITFNEDITISNLIIGNVLKFHSCIFQSSLHFENDSLNNIELLEFSKTEILNLEFKGLNISKHNNRTEYLGNIFINYNCNIKSLIIFDCKIDYGILVSDSRIEDLIIENLIVTSGGINFSRTQITEILILENSVANNLNIISNSIINKIVSTNLSSQIIISDSNFNQNVTLKAFKANSIKIDNSNFANNVSLLVSSLINSLLINNVDFKTFSLDYSNTDKFNGNQTEQIILNDIIAKDFFRISGFDTSLDILTINVTSKLNGVFDFSGFNNTNCSFKGSNINATINLVDFKIDSIHLDKFINHNNISFTNIKGSNEKSIFKIRDSNLKNCNIINVDLTSFKNIEIENSALTDTNFINTIWFKHTQLNNHLTKETGYYAKTREVYRQLKFALEKQGDRIQALNFKHLEMHTFKEDLFSKYKWHQRIFNQDRFILWVGQTNNFGQSWLKPVGIFALFLFPLYFLIMVGLSEKLHYTFHFNYSSVQTTISEFGKYFYAIPDLINPVHSLKKLFPTHEIPALTYWLDFLLKLISSFFIFQTIAAFRKYMK